MPKTVTAEQIVAVSARGIDGKLKKQIARSTRCRTQRRDARATMSRDRQSQRVRGQLERVATGGFNLRSFHGRRRLRAFGY